MGLLSKKNSSGGTVGLDVDGRYLAAVQLSGDQVSRVASVALDPGLVTDGEVRDPDALAEALKSFFGSTELPKSVQLGVLNQQIVVRQIELPYIDKGAERDAAVRFQAAEAIAMPLDDAVLDYQVVEEASGSDGAHRMQVVVVAARSSMIDDFVTAARAAGLKPRGIDLNAFALVRALADEGDATATTARVFCHVATMTNLAIAVGGACLFARPLTTSWTPEEPAAATALADEIRLSIDSYAAQAASGPVTEVVLSGPGSSDEGLVAELGTVLDLPVSVARPLGSIATTELPADEDPHRYTLAAGLALGAAA
jgi:type IV pilus assembly protein PilM